MRKKVLISVLLVIVLFIGIKAGLSDNKKINNGQLHKQTELLSDTLSIIQKEYVADVKNKDLVYGALKGMLDSLDPYSQFMDPDTYNELKIDAEGEYGGLGVEVTLKDKLLTVITPIEDTPAWRAGIKPGDCILKINGKLTRDMPLADAVKKLRGKPHEAVNITVLRGSKEKLLEFKIIREVIKIRNIKYAGILENGIGYIRVLEFSENTLPELNKALSSLSKQKMRALILDLRNNPGGLLNVAVQVAGRFIPEDKMVVYTKGRKAKRDLEFFSGCKNAILDLPLVILINEGSASGSEVIAGALQDYKRATIIGAKSFGKGSVQTVIPLADGSALRLSTSHYFTPRGKIIQDKGVVPDILISPKESDSREDTNKDFDYKSDEQVMRALHFLKDEK